MSEASEKSKTIVKPLRRGWHRFSLDIAQEREIARKHGQLAETLYEAAVHPYVQRLLLCLLVVDIIAAVVEMILRAYVWFDTCSLHQTDVRTATTTTCIITLIVAALFLVELLSLAFSLRHHFFRSWHRWMDALLVAMMLTFTILTLRSVADDASIARYVVVMMRVVRIFHATAMTVNQISEKNTIEKGAVVEKRSARLKHGKTDATRAPLPESDDRGGGVSAPAAKHPSEGTLRRRERLGLELARGDVYESVLSG